MILPSLLVVAFRDDTHIAPSCDSQCSFQASLFLTIRNSLAQSKRARVRSTLINAPSKLARFLFGAGLD